MATARADMASAAATRYWLGWIDFARPKEFAFRSFLLAITTLALAPVVLWKHDLATQVYLGALVVIHVAALAIFIRGTRKEDVAPSPFGLFWRATGLAVMVALLMMIKLVPDSPWFWPSLFAIWAVHTAGLSLLHVRAGEGARCPFLPRSL